ncbi:hypothetical protein Tco_0096853 [Tanacetum coccineum]
MGFGADDEEIFEDTSTGVIVLGYDGLPMHPVALPSPDYIPARIAQTPPVPQDEDERELMFVQAHDPDCVPKPIYPEYIPLEDEHEFPTEEQPLPPDPEEYEDDEIEDEEEEHLAPADSAIVVPVDEPVFPPEGTKPVIPPPSTDITIGARITVRPQTSISLPPEAEVERLLAMTTPSPSPPISLSPPSAGERLVRSMAPPAHSSPPPSLVDVVIAALPSPPLPPLPLSLYIPPPVDRRDDVPESEQPPHKRLCLFALGSKYEVGESFTTRPTRGQGVDYRDTWVDPEEVVSEIAPMTVGEVNTRVTELAELHEHDTQDLYALLEDAQDSRTRISQRVTMDLQRAHAIGLSQAVHYDLQTHREQMQQAEMAELQETDRRHQAHMIETLRVMKDKRREIGDIQAELLALREQRRRARQPAPDARVPYHQDASRDADSYI